MTRNHSPANVSDQDLIAQLRMTCMAVANATVVTAPTLTELRARSGDVRLSVVARPTASRKPIILSLALAAALMLALVWTGRSDNKIDALDAFAATLVHPVPGYPLPTGFGLDQIGANELTYRSGNRAFRLGTVQSLDSDATTILLRGGKAARVVLAADETTVTWEERPGIIVQLSATGSWTIDELSLLTNRAVMVSEPAWRDLTSKSGFVDISRSVNNDRYEFKDQASFDGPPPPGFDGPTAKHLERSLIGDLQHGVNVKWGCCVSGPAELRPRSASLNGGERVVIYANPGDARVDLVRINGSVFASATLACDPGAPNLCLAVVALTPSDGLPPGGLRSRFYDRAGTQVEEVEGP
jgi:hypothetical protein